MNALTIAVGNKTTKEITSFLVAKMFTDEMTSETIEFLLEDPERFVGAFASPAVVRKFFNDDVFQGVFFAQPASYRRRALNALTGESLTADYNTLESLGADYRVVAAMCRLNPQDYTSWSDLVSDPDSLNAIKGVQPELIQFSNTAMDFIGGNEQALASILETESGHNFVANTPYLISQAANTIGNSSSLVTTISAFEGGTSFLLTTPEIANAIRSNATTLATLNTLVEQENAATTWAEWISDEALFDPVFETDKFLTLLELPKFVDSLSEDTVAMGKVANSEKSLNVLFSSITGMNTLASKALSRDILLNSAKAISVQTDMSSIKLSVEVLQDRAASAINSWNEVLSDNLFLDKAVADAKVRELIGLSGDVYDLVSSSGTAIIKLAAGYAALNPSNYTSINDVVTDQSAIDAIESKEEAHKVLSQSAAWLGKLVIGRTSLDPANFANMVEVAENETAMLAVTENADAMKVVVENSVAVDVVKVREMAMNKISDHVVARTAIGKSGLAYEILKTENMAFGKLVAGEAGLDPTAYNNMDAVASDASARGAIGHGGGSYDLVKNSDMAMSKIIAGYAALSPTTYRDIDEVVATASELTAIGFSGEAYDFIDIHKRAAGKLVAAHAGLNTRDYESIDNLAADFESMETVATTEAARTAIGLSGETFNAIAENNMAVGKLLIGYTELDVYSYADVDAVMKATNGASTVINNSDCRAVILRSYTAFNSLITTDESTASFYGSSSVKDAWLGDPTNLALMLSVNKDTSKKLWDDGRFVEALKDKITVDRQVGTHYYFWDLQIDFNVVSTAYSSYRANSTSTRSNRAQVYLYNGSGTRHTLLSVTGETSWDDYETTINDSSGTAGHIKFRFETYASNYTNPRITKRTNSPTGFTWSLRFDSGHTSYSHYISGLHFDRK